MAVYVDDMQAPFRGMIMCHMMADTHEELVAMADKINVQRKWIQKPHTAYEHFDICLKKRALAVKYGAEEITWRRTGEIVMERKAAELPKAVRKTNLV